MIEAWLLEHVGWQLGEGRQGRSRRRLDAFVRNAGSVRGFAQQLASNPTIQRQVVESLAIHETSFFRHSAQHDALRDELFPELEQRIFREGRPQQIHAWSSACSTGEEPFSLAMELLDRFPSVSGWSCKVYASDVSHRVVEQARNCTWPIDTSDQIPSDQLQRYMLQGHGDASGRMRAGPTLRKIVRFFQHNLLEELPEGLAPFDLVLCRNVLFYFSRENQEKILRRMMNYIRPHGYLILGPSDHAETRPFPVQSKGHAIFQVLPHRERPVQR